MDTTDLTVRDATVIARTTIYDHGDTVFYSVKDADGATGADGTIVVKPSRLGMHPKHGVMLTLGGYKGRFQIGDWSVTGSLVCTGDDMTPGPHPSATQYPLNQVRKDDPAAADLLGDLATAIAFNYIHHYTGTGLR